MRLRSESGKRYADGKALAKQIPRFAFYAYHRAAKREWGCSFLYFTSLMQKI